MSAGWWILVALVVAGAGAWWLRSRKAVGSGERPVAAANRWDRMAEAARRQAADPFRFPPVEMSVLCQGLSAQGTEAVIATYRGHLSANLESLGLTDARDRDMLPDLRYRDDPDWVLRLDGLTAPQARDLVERVRQAGGRARVRTFQTREKGFQAGGEAADLELEFAVWTRAPAGQDLGPLSGLYRDFSQRNAGTLGLGPEDLSPTGEPEREGEAQVWQPLTWDQAWAIHQEAVRMGIPSAIRGLLPFPGE